MGRIGSKLADRSSHWVDTSVTPVASVLGRRRLEGALVAAVLVVAVFCAPSAFAARNSSSSHLAHAEGSQVRAATAQDTKTARDPEAAQKSGIAPSVTIDGNNHHEIVMAYIANDGSNDIMITTSHNGAIWSTPVNTGQSSDKTPAIEFWGDQQEFLMAYVANNGSNDLFVTTSTNGGATWSASEYTGQQSSTAPANWPGLLVFVANNGSNDLLAITSSDGTTWSASSNLGSQQSKAAPAVTVNFNGQYVLVYVANNSSNNLIVTTSYDGTVWSAGTLVGQQSPTAPAIAVEGNNPSLLMSYVANNGSDDLFVTSSTNNGETWSTSAPVTGQSSSNGPGLSPIYNNKSDFTKWVIAYVANNGSNDLLATTSSDAITWSGSKKV